MPPASLDSSFDPDGPAPDGTLFGLPHSLGDARVRVLPVPWDATASSGLGTAGGPAAVLAASAQVDLFDRRYGEAWRAGFALDEAPAAAAIALEMQAAAGAARAGDEAALVAVNAAGARLHEQVADWVRAQLRDGAIPAVLGGDHSVASGAIVAAAGQHGGLGVLHVDAHADLRDAYEGFRWSHASVMHNVLALSDASLSSVGLRDLGHAEHRRIESDPRIHAVFDDELAAAAAAGQPWGALLDRAVAALPDVVWVSFDIDGLDPALCPGTGTPVPGGLSWHQATELLAKLAASGRRVVGFDLCEVGPGPADALVAARLLYQLGASAIASQLASEVRHVRP